MEKETARRSVLTVNKLVVVLERLPALIPLRLFVKHHTGRISTQKYTQVHTGTHRYDTGTHRYTQVMTHYIHNSIYMHSN